MDTMRMEKGYLHWGHDMSPEENQYEAGLKFAISFKKNICCKRETSGIILL